MNKEKYKILKYISRIKFFEDQCKNMNVLHLGCSSGKYIQDRIDRGSFLHKILDKYATKIYGLDIDEKSLEIMKNLGFDNLFLGNVEKLDEVDFKTKFDVVIAGDLLEHITCPGSMLEGVKPLLNEGGKFIISTNNAFGIHYQLKRWMGSYSEHIEHVCFYSPETLYHTFERHGFKVQQLFGAFTVSPNTIKQKLVFIIGYPILKIFPVLSGTLVVVATL